MRPPRRLARVAAALAVALPGAAFAGCGDDEPGSSAETTVESTTTTVSDPELTTEKPPAAEPEITDEGHEGGGPDPGTEEAESAPPQSGGAEVENPELEVEPQPEGGSGANSSGGASPTDAFGEFCDENPGACE